MPISNCTDEDIGYETEGPKAIRETIFKLGKRILQWSVQNRILLFLARRFAQKVNSAHEREHTLQPRDFSFRPLIFKKGLRVKFHKSKRPRAEIAIVKIGAKNCKIEYKDKESPEALKDMPLKTKLGLISLHGNGKKGYHVEVFSGF